MTTAASVNRCVESRRAAIFWHVQFAVYFCDNWHPFAASDLTTTCLVTESNGSNMHAKDFSRFKTLSLKLKKMIEYVKWKLANKVKLDKLYISLDLTLILFPFFYTVEGPHTWAEPLSYSSQNLARGRHSVRKTMWLLNLKFHLGLLLSSLDGSQ